MSGYCLDCGNTICLCDEISEMNNYHWADFGNCAEDGLTIIKLLKENNHLKSQLAEYKKALELYADWKSWRYEYRSDDMICIKVDANEIEYTEADGDIFKNIVGGFKAREVLAKYKSE